MVTAVLVMAVNEGVAPSEGERGEGEGDNGDGDGVSCPGDPGPRGASAA